MKKEHTSRSSRLIARIFRVRSWLDYDRAKAFFIYMVQGTKRLAEPEAKAKRESFEAAVDDLGLSEAALKKKQRALLRWSRLMCWVASVVMVWAIYHGTQGNARASLTSFVVVCVALVLAFRYHFWYFQIKSRKLGCSLREWFEQGLIGSIGGKKSGKYTLRTGIFGGVANSFAIGHVLAVHSLVSLVCALPKIQLLGV